MFYKCLITAFNENRISIFRYFRTHKVREAVHQAEEAARKAAEDSAKHGDNSAELRVAAIREKLASQRAAKQRLHAKQNLNVTQSSLRKWEHPMS